MMPIKQRNSLEVYDNNKIGQTPQMEQMEQMDLKDITNAIRDNGYSWDSASATGGYEDGSACVKITKGDRYCCKASTRDKAIEGLYNMLVEAKIINPELPVGVSIPNGALMPVSLTPSEGMIDIIQENTSIPAVIHVTKQCALTLAEELINYAGWQPMSTAPRDGRKILVRLKSNIHSDSPVMEVRYNSDFKDNPWRGPWDGTIAYTIRLSDQGLVGWLPTLGNTKT